MVQEGESCVILLKENVAIEIISRFLGFFKKSPSADLSLFSSARPTSSIFAFECGALLWLYKWSQLFFSVLVLGALFLSLLCMCKRL